jgi:hypothetical protein
VVYGFQGLGHYPIIRSHYQNGNVGNLGSAGPHGGEGRMTGRVQKSKFSAIYLHLVSANMLGDTPGFTIRYVGLSDNIK